MNNKRAGTKMQKKRAHNLWMDVSAGQDMVYIETGWAGCVVDHLF